MMKITKKIIVGDELRPTRLHTEGGCGGNKSIETDCLR